MAISRLTQLVRQTLPLRKALQRRPQLLLVDETPPDLHGYDDGARVAAEIHLPGMTARIQPPVPMPLPPLAQVSPFSVHVAVRPPGSRPELPPAVPRAQTAHCHRIWAVRAQAPWRPLCWTPHQVSCGASGARSSIYAYSACSTPAHTGAIRAPWRLGYLGRLPGKSGRFPSWFSTPFAVNELGSQPYPAVAIYNTG